MFAYPARVMPDDNGSVMVTFPDVPEAVSFGDDESDALAHAVEALETALAAYIADRKPLPAPSRTAEGPRVAPTLLGELKLAVYDAMRARGWRKVDLARAMGQNPRQIDRLLDLHHASAIVQLEQALAACGRKATVQTSDLAA